MTKREIFLRFGPYVVTFVPFFAVVHWLVEGRKGYGQLVEGAVMGLFISLVASYTRMRREMPSNSTGR